MPATSSRLSVLVSIAILALLLSVFAVLALRWNSLPHPYPLAVAPMSGEVHTWADKSVWSVYRSPALSLLLVVSTFLLEAGCRAALVYRGAEAPALVKNALLWKAMQGAIVAKEALYAIAFLGMVKFQLPPTELFLVRAANLASVIQIGAFIWALWWPRRAGYGDLLGPTAEEAGDPDAARVFLFDRRTIINFANPRAKAFLVVFTLFMVVTLGTMKL